MSLYVDGRTPLPEDEWRVGEYGGKEFNIKTIGKSGLICKLQYNRNAQPYYVMVDLKAISLVDLQVTTAILKCLLNI